MKLIKWFAGFFEDQEHSASSKRAVTYFACFLLWRVTEQHAKGVEPNETLIWALVALIAFGIGAITTEIVSKILADRSKSTTSTTEITTTNQTAVTPTQ